MEVGILFLLMLVQRKLLLRLIHLTSICAPILFRSLTKESAEIISRQAWNRKTSI